MTIYAYGQKLVKIGEAAKLLGTSPDTLRKWEATGELLPKKSRSHENKQFMDKLNEAVNELSKENATRPQN